MRTLFITLLLLTSGLAGCLSSEDDGDGLPAATERAGWTVRVYDGADLVDSYHVTSDPESADADGDGLNDFQETGLSSDPNKADTDGDGLLDGPTLTLDADDPRVAQFRAAGILELDGFRFIGEQSFDLPTGTDQRLEGNSNLLNSDSDRDGLADGDELVGWTLLGSETETIVRSHPFSADTDNDGLRDELEREFRADPGSTDTDADGTKDAQDAAPTCDLRLTLSFGEIRINKNKDPEKTLQPGADVLVLTSILNAKGNVDMQELGPVQVTRDQSTDLAFDTGVIDIPDTGSTIPARDTLAFKLSFQVFDKDGDGGGAVQNTSDRILVNGEDNLVEVTVGYHHEDGASLNGMAVTGTTTTGADGELKYGVTVDCV